MWNWSVLNDSIQDFLETDRYPQKNIRWDTMQIEINNILRQLSNVQNQEDLYAVAAFHQHWHSAVINRILFSALNHLRDRFGDFYINMLMEVFSEAAYIAQNDHPHKEADYTRMIEGGFSDIFPELTFVKREAVFDGFRIDLLAKEPRSGRDVLFELKLEANDPTPQLVNYNASFAQPILIGITEKRLSEWRRHSDIYYFTYADLNRRAAANLRRQFGGTEKAFSYFHQNLIKSLNWPNTLGSNRDISNGSG